MTDEITVSRELLQQVLYTLTDVWVGEMDEEQIYDLITTLRKVLIKSQKHTGLVMRTSAEPVAWAMFVDGDLIDVIGPDEHATYEGNYITPLFTTHPDISN